MRDPDHRRERAEEREREREKREHLARHAQQKRAEEVASKLVDLADESYSVLTNLADTVRAEATITSAQSGRLVSLASKLALWAYHLGRHEGTGSAVRVLTEGAKPEKATPCTCGTVGFFHEPGCPAND